MIRTNKYYFYLDYLHASAVVWDDRYVVMIAVGKRNRISEYFFGKDGDIIMLDHRGLQGKGFL